MELDRKIEKKEESRKLGDIVTSSFTLPSSFSLSVQAEIDFCFGKKGREEVMLESYANA